MKTNEELFDAILDTKGEVLLLREDFIDLKKHVNDELQVQKDTLALKADRKDVTLWVLWKQSPTWLKVIGGIGTAAVAVTSAAIAAIQRIPF